MNTNGTNDKDHEKYMDQQTRVNTFYKKEDSFIPKQSLEEQNRSVKTSMQSLADNKISDFTGKEYQTFDTEKAVFDA